MASIDSPQRPASGTPTDDNSGLLDIQSMAQSTKQRVTQRADTDPDELLFASARPSALRDVVLPQTGQARLAVGTEASVPAIMRSRAGTRAPWLLAGAAGALMLVGGAVALLLFGGTETPATTAAPASSAGAGAPVPSPEKTPVAEPGGLVADTERNRDDDGQEADNADGETASVQAVAAAETTPTSEAMDVAAAAPSEPVAEALVVDGKADQQHAAQPRAGKQAVAKAIPRRRPADKTSDAKAETVVARAPKQPRAATARAKSRAKPQPRARSQKNAEPNLDDLLDEAAGAPELGPETTVKKKSRPVPAKESLTRNDINSTLRAAGSAVQACANKHGAEGMLQVRIRIAPSGSVTSATAQGKFKGSAVGSCVAAVIKNATFPAYAGAPITVTFPFLLQ